jgi:ABC-type Fe3+-hydroxamate transport system substrate-binding protein
VRRILALIALLAALAIAACGSSDNKGGSGSGTTASTSTDSVVVTTTTKNGATKTTTTKIAAGKVTTIKPKTKSERTFVTSLNRRCIAAIGSTRSIAAPTATVTSARAYARRATPAVRRAIAVLRTSHPSKNQVVAVATLLGSYGQTITLLRTLEATKGPKTQDAKTAAQSLPPALKRVLIYAKAAALPSCRPPGL